MYLINGQWRSTLPANDRAVQFGDGCFTTARIKNGEVRFLADHLQRLQQACAALMMTPPDWQQLSEEMQRLAAVWQLAVLKVIITRGPGGRGYSAVNCRQPTRILAVSPYPDFYAQWHQEGVALGISAIRLGINPALAGIKHLNRLEQVLIRTHLAQTGYQETLVLDSNGDVVECCAANVFWRKGRCVYTPPLDGAGVNGTMRQHIIATLAHSPWQFALARAGVDVLADADEIIICNALMPVIPVRQVETRYYTARDLYQYLAPFCE